MTSHGLDTDREAVNLLKEDAPVFDPRAYWESRLSEFDDVLGVGFTSLGRQYNEWMYRLRRLVFLREMSRMNMNIAWDTQRVLDIGSGTGFYVHLWRELGVRLLVGCDITDVAVLRLQRIFPNFDFKRLDVTEPGVLPCNSFDAISAFDVLFHIVDDEGFARAIRNLHRAVKPGGLLVFSDNFVHGARICAPHQISRSLSEIESLIAKTGFVIEHRTPMFVTMNAPHDTKNWAYAFLWKAFSNLVRRSETLGFIAGAALFALDRVLTQILHESPTTEMMVCRKPL